jgi:hypothetical protein
VASHRELHEEPRDERLRRARALVAAATGRTPGEARAGGGASRERARPDCGCRVADGY